MKLKRVLLSSAAAWSFLSVAGEHLAFGAGEEEPIGELEGSDAELSDDLPAWAVGAEAGVFFNRAKATVGIGPSFLVGIDPETAALVSYQDQSSESKRKKRSSSYSVSTATPPVVKSWETETNVSGVFKFGARRVILGSLFLDVTMAMRQATSTYQFDYEGSTGDGSYKAMGFWLGVGPGVHIRRGSIVTTIKVTDLLVPVYRYSMGEKFNRGDSNATSPAGIFETEAKDNAKSALDELMFQVVSVGIAFGAQ